MRGCVLGNHHVGCKLSMYSVNEYVHGTPPASHTFYLNQTQMSNEHVISVKEMQILQSPIKQLLQKKELFCKQKCMHRWIGAKLAHLCLNPWVDLLKYPCTTSLLQICRKDTSAKNFYISRPNSGCTTTANGTYMYADQMTLICVYIVYSCSV